MKPKVSIIIANFNGESYLNRCLDAVLVTAFRNFEIILVDDGSTDRSLEIIQEYQKKDNRIKILKNETNLGASASRNKAIKAALGLVIVFLDNDTKVEKNWLGELIKTIEADESVGGAQAVLLDMKNQDLVQSCGGLLIPYVAWLAPFYQWENYQKIKSELKPINIVAVSAALAFKKDVLKKVGFFDEKEAIFTEDIDLCWRVWIAGFKIVLSPSSKVFHLSKSVEARETMNVDYRRVYYTLARNSIRSIIKNYEIFNLFKFLPACLFINIARELLVFVKRKDPSALFVTMSALIWNILNFEDTLRERKLIQKSRVLSDKNLFETIFTKGSMLDIYNKFFKQTKLL